MASDRVSHKDKVAELYTNNLKALKLAPKHVIAIKDAMLKASRRSNGHAKSIMAAANAWLKEKGIVSKEKTKEKTAKPNKSKKAAPEPAPEPPKKGRPPTSAAETILKQSEGGNVALKGDHLKGVPKGNIDMTKLDRKTLKGMAADLGVTITKSMSDDEVRNAVSTAMIGVDKKVVQSLDEMEPAKVDELKNCIGLFIDLTHAACIACPVQKQCRDLFEQHRQEGFVVFERLKAKLTKKVEDDDDGEKTAEVLAEEDDNKKGKKKEKKNGRRLSYDPKREVECYDVGKIKEFIKTLDTVSVNGVEVDEHDFKLLLDLKKTVPENLKEVADVITRHYEPDDDSKESFETLVMFWVEYFEQIGILKQIKA